jgi:hypothetical protein
VRCGPAACVRSYHALALAPTRQPEDVRWAAVRKRMPCPRRGAPAGLSATPPLGPARLARGRGSQQPTLADHFTSSISLGRHSFVKKGCCSVRHRGLSLVVLQPAQGVFRWHQKPRRHRTARDGGPFVRLFASVIWNGGFPILTACVAEKLQRQENAATILLTRAACDA